VARCGADDGAIVRRLKEAESRATERHAPQYAGGIAGRRVETEQREARCHREETHATEEARRVAIREPAGEWRCESERERPGRDEKTGLDRAVAEALNLERQRHECRHLRREAEHRGRKRQRETANAQQVKRDEGRSPWPLMPHEQPCEHATTADLTQCQQHRSPVSECLQSTQQQSHRGGVQGGARDVEPARRAFAVRQGAERDHDRHCPERHVDAEQPAPVRYRQQARGDGRSHRSGRRDHEGVDTQRVAKRAVGVGMTYQRAVHAHDSGGTDALHDARQAQGEQARGKCAAERRDREDGESGL